MTSRTLIGIPTYGNLNFTKLTVRSIQETVKKPADVMLIVGQPGDLETGAFGIQNSTKVIAHDRNCGLTGSCNDIFDWAWKHGNYDFAVIMGNDVIVYPGCIDGMIEMAETGKWDQVCASMYDVQSLLRDHPEAGQFFSGPSFIFSDFESRPWELHKPSSPYGEEPGALKDIQNCTLYTRGAFEKLGYFDEGFENNGYYSDNDYARRGVNGGVRGVGAPHCEFFHFWSRSVHQGPVRPNHAMFAENRNHYLQKWGGDFGAERKAAPVKISKR